MKALNAILHFLAHKFYENLHFWLHNTIKKEAILAIPAIPKEPDIRQERPIRV